MSRLLAPVAAGLAAGAVAFAAVALATGGGDERPPAPSSGRELFARMGCGSCHTLSAAESNGMIGPNLDAELPDHTRDSLIAKIESPGPVSAMPDDFAARMSDAELAALVDFLLASR